MELLLFLIAWGIPIFIVIFVVASLSQILKALGQITAELTQIREVLERDVRPESRI